MNPRSWLAVLVLVVCSASLFADDTTFTLNRTPTGGVEVKVGGKPFATYVIDQGNKPYVWPIYGPTGKAMTRAYPMEDVAGEQHDHPHQRGLTFGHEDIDDHIDTWQEHRTFQEMLDEAQAKGKSDPNAKKRLALVGSEKHRDFTELKADQDRAVIVETLDYLDPNGKRLMSEQRRITFHLIGDMRAIDWDQDLVANDGPVTLGDSKDAGLGIRVPTSMAVETKTGGHLINSNGLEDEKAWGKPADWCDYNGTVEGDKVGIAMLDHPSSYRHPTPWHIRTYGLFCANPFGSHALDKAAPERPTDLAAGQHLVLFHRLLFHTGDEKSAKIAEAYQTYAKEMKTRGE